MTVDGRTMMIMKTTFLTESRLCFNNKHKLGADARLRYSFIDTDSFSVQLTPPLQLYFDIRN